MTVSPLTSTIKRTSDLLMRGAADQVTEYENRFQTLQTLYDTLLADFVVTDFNHEKARNTAREFFGSQTVRFAAIDGTMYSRPLFDLIIFFGGAYTSTGTITFSENNKPTVQYDEKTLQQNAGISSVVPIYINEVPDIDHNFSDPTQPNEINVNKPLTDESILNNATISNWIMTFAEFYLAYKIATDPNQNRHIILMDRSLSIERASLLYDTRNPDQWKTKSALIGYKIDQQPIDENHLAIGRQHIINPNLKIPAPRADYLRHAIINLLQQQGTSTKTQILKELGIEDEKRTKRAEKYLRTLVNKQIIIEKATSYTLDPKYTDTWTRLKKLVTTLGDHFFYQQQLDTKSTTNLMKIHKDGKEQWLTTLDIAFLTLFSLEMLIEQCWNNNILLIGITKDTAARDFKRQLIPIMQNQNLLKNTIKHEQLDNLPNTDRMILQSASLFNPDKMKVPWSLIEYDSAFKTMIPDPKNGKNYILGARKNRISIEKTFLKTYIQLSQAASDPMLRSNVLLIDRLTHPQYDYTEKSTIHFLNEFGSAKEPVETILFQNNTVENPLQNLIMITLIAMTSPSIPEAFGHNKPLFIADKIAKHNYAQFKQIADSTAQWLLNNHKLRKFIFYMSTFRERRATIEATRRETP